MPVTEAPTTFYLGRGYDPASGMVSGEVVYLNSRDLSNHAVILGMSGSGKTGLGAVLMEEALIDQIPVIILDTKGDMTSLALTFPGLTGEEFLPWISPENALRAGRDAAAYASEMAQTWREGLASWEIPPDRLKFLKENTHFKIYTPGSDAGLPVNILSMLAPPREGWLGREDYQRERIGSLVHALLTLLGRQTITPQDREYILLAYIVEHFWTRGQMLTLTDLVTLVGTPPFDTVAMLPLENFFPATARQQLAYELNTLFTTPAFQLWLQGNPLYIPDLLYGSDRRPYASIFSLVHLPPIQQAFFITVLLQELRAWMTTQTTSASLRALVYIDEVFNFFPPYPYNPPTKTPLLRLLKEAAPYGIGMIIGAQNAQDIDYKGLANAGTWLIGRLDNEADRLRVIEGLQVSNTAGRQVDLTYINQLLAALPGRTFLIDSIFNPGVPVLVGIRWTMSFMIGGLTPQQIHNLMEMQIPAPAYPAPVAPVYALAAPPPTLPEMPPPTTATIVVSASPSLPAPVSTPPATMPVPAGAPTLPIGYSYERPRLPAEAVEYFLPANIPLTQAVDFYLRQNPHLPAAKPAQQFYLLYQPFLLAQIKARYFEQNKYIDVVDTFAYHLYSLPSNNLIEWEQYRAAPIVRETISDTPYPHAAFGTPDPAFADDKRIHTLREEALDHVYRNAIVAIPANEVLQVYGMPGRPFQDFQAQLATAARIQRDTAIEQLAERYRVELGDMEDRYRQQVQKWQSDRQELETSGQEFMINAAEMGFNFLTRGSLMGVMSRMARLRGYRNRAQTNVREDELAVGLINTEMDQVQMRFNVEVEQLNQYWAQVAAAYTEIHVKPFRDDTYLEMFGIAWKPFYYLALHQQQVILPAWQAVG